MVEKKNEIGVRLNLIGDRSGLVHDFFLSYSNPCRNYCHTLTGGRKAADLPFKSDADPVPGLLFLDPNRLASFQNSVFVDVFMSQVAACILGI